LLQALIACAHAQMFGALLRSLQITTDQVTGVYWDLQTNNDGPIGAASLASDYLAELGDLIGNDGVAAARGARDQAEMFADKAIAEWVRSMTTLAEDPTTATALFVPREQAMMLARELERAARRLDLRGQIAEVLRRRASFQHRSAAAAQKPVMIVEQAINNFVHLLGYDRLPPDKRPEVPRGTRRIFAPRVPVSGLPPLGPRPTPYGLNFEVDWMMAMQLSIEANAQDAGSGTIDVAANERLGAIIARLDGAGR